MSLVNGNKKYSSAMGVWELFFYYWISVEVLNSSFSALMVISYCYWEVIGYVHMALCDSDNTRHPAWQDQRSKLWSQQKGLQEEFHKVVQTCYSFSTPSPLPRTYLLDLPTCFHSRGLPLKPCGLSLKTGASEPCTSSTNPHLGCSVMSLNIYSHIFFLLFKTSRRSACPGAVISRIDGFWGKVSLFDAADKALGARYGRQHIDWSSEKIKKRK